MEKKDFKKDQLVYLKYIGDRRSGTVGSISEATVKSIGSKYITVIRSRWGEYKFDMTEGFRQVTQYSADYQLYLTRQEIEDENEIIDIIELISSQLPKWGGIPKNLSLDQLRRIKDIINETK